MPLFLALLLAAQIQAPTPTVQPPRFAVLVPKAIHPITQPSFDRWVNSTATRFAGQFDVTAVQLPAGYPAQSASPQLCNSLNLVGFIEPARLWNISATTISMTAMLVIRDCDGDEFFDGETQISEKRNAAMIPQEQVESIASRATGTLLSEFSTVINAHKVLWSRFLATGSLTDRSATTSPVPSPNDHYGV